MNTGITESKARITKAAEEMADIAFTQGYAEGYASGRERGYKLGYKEGFDDAAHAAEEVVKETMKQHGVKIRILTRREKEKANDNEE